MGIRKAHEVVLTWKPLWTWPGDPEGPPIDETAFRVVTGNAPEGPPAVWAVTATQEVEAPDRAGQHRL